MKKNQHFLLTILLCFITSLQVQAQYNLPQSRIWAMGNKVGLDFTNLSNPASITTSLTNANEAAASICDTSGNMLFYTNGMIAWDKNGNPMPHGSALIGNTNSTLSTTQGAVIIPIPDSANKYYLFSLTAVSNCLLYCNVIDMNKNSGLGDVDSSFYLCHTTIGNGSLLKK
jgi:hypothetical protein